MCVCVVTMLETGHLYHLALRLVSTWNFKIYRALRLLKLCCDVYKVYIFGIEMSQRICMCYQILLKMLISEKNDNKSLFSFKNA